MNDIPQLPALDETAAVPPCEVQNLFRPENYRLHIFGFERLTLLAKRITLPEISTNAAVTNFRGSDYKYQGDSLSISQLTIEFFLEENMQSYIKLFNWLKHSVPRHDPDYHETTGGYVDDKPTLGMLGMYSDADELVFTYVLKDIFPVSLTNPDLEAAQATPEPIVITATFEVNEIYIDTTTDTNG